MKQFPIILLLIAAFSANAATPTLPAPSVYSVATDLNGNLLAPGAFFTQNILAGSGVTITPSGNKITIASTGGGGGGGGTTINGQSGASQTLTVGTSGTDFAISSAANVHSFNLPTASASARGALSSSDWSLFNGKVGSSRQILAGTGLAGGGTLAGDVTLTLATASSSIASALTDESGTGALLFGNSPTISTPTINGVVVWQTGTRQTFAPNTTTPGFNVGAVASDPSSLSNGDIWLNSTSTRLRTRNAGANVDVATGGQFDSVLTTVSHAANLAIDLNVSQYQTVTLTGDTTLTTANRPTSAVRAVVVFFTASGAQRVVTLNGSWKNYGSASTITIPSGKEAYLSITAFGSAETDIRCNWSLQP